MLGVAISHASSQFLSQSRRLASARSTVSRAVTSAVMAAPIRAAKIHGKAALGSFFTSHLITLNFVGAEADAEPHGDAIDEVEIGNDQVGQQDVGIAESGFAHAVEHLRRRLRR